jgi:hypothetical protein
LDATEITVTEANGDNIAGIISKIESYRYGKNLVIVLSTKVNPKLAMEELYPFER